MDALSPFLLDLNLSPDHSAQDIDAEWRSKSHAQVTLSRFLKGEATLEEYDDALADVGVDPNLYWEVVEDNVDHVVATETAVEDSEWLLVDQFGCPLSAVA